MGCVWVCEVCVGGWVCGCVRCVWVGGYVGVGVHVPVTYVCRYSTTSIIRTPLAKFRNHWVRISKNFR